MEKLLGPQYGVCLWKVSVSGGSTVILLRAYWRFCLSLFHVGLTSEGIYRISGFADDVEALKNSFDKGNTQLYVFLHLR